MAWGDPQDYWWLRPKEEQNHLQSIQLGAQLRQQAITNALRQKDQELENQRTGIQVQEYFSKKELQNREMEGVSSLAKSMSQIGDMSNPMIEEVILGELSKNSTPGMVKIAEQFLDNHRQALQFKQRQEELAELRLSREQIAGASLAERVARREGTEAYNTERLAIWQQRADTGQMDSESRAEWRTLQSDLARDKFIESNEDRDKTHEERTRRLDILQQQADAGTIRAQDLKEYRTLITDLAVRKQDFSESESATIHQEISRKLDLFERNAATREARFKEMSQRMPPEQRLRYQNKVKALSDESVLGKVMDPKTGKRTAEEYQRRAKAIEDEFFGGKAMPLKNPITKEEYDKLPVGAEYIAPDGSTRVKK